jgi:Tol biopolymer transport system component
VTFRVATTALFILCLTSTAFTREGDVVYMAAIARDGIDELFHVNTKNREVTKLNGPLVPGGRVISFQIGPRGRQVVYLAEQDTDGVPELYHVSLDKKGLASVQPTKLNGQLAQNGGVLSFEFGPKGRQIVYRAEQDDDNVIELYRVSLEKKSLVNAQPSKLNAPLVEGGDVSFFKIGPRGSQVVYAANQEHFQVSELYHLILDKKSLADVQPIKLNGPLVAGGNVDFSSIELGPKGRQVVYRADQDTDEVHELYHVSLDKKSLKDVQPTKLNGPLVKGGDVDLLSIEIGPKGREVVYRADQDTDEAHELYRVGLDKKSLASVQATKLNGPLVNGGSVAPYFMIGPKGRRVVYVADQDTDEVNEIYHVSLDKMSLANVQPTKLNGELVTGGSVSISFGLGPKGRQVVYYADKDTVELNELFHVSLDKKSLANVQPTKLNGTLVKGGRVVNFGIGPKGRQVVYRAEQDTDGVFELFHVSLGKKNLEDALQTKLSGPLVEGGDVGSFEIGPKGRLVVYKADQDTDGVRELFQVGLTNKSLKDVMPGTLSGALADDGVFVFKIAP